MSAASVEAALKLSSRELQDRLKEEIYDIRDQLGYEVTLANPKELSTADLDACFNLVRYNLKKMYQQSSFGWNDEDKKAEMQEPATRYFLVHQDSKVVAFLSFQIELEFESSCFYLYEIQVNEEHRNKGLGKALLHMYESLASTIGVVKLMMTVFRKNEGAVKLYKSVGYSLDPSSPKGQVRRTTVHESDYMILSKTTACGTTAV